MNLIRALLISGLAASPTNGLKEFPAGVGVTPNTKEEGLKATVMEKAVLLNKDGRDLGNNYYYYGQNGNNNNGDYAGYGDAIDLTKYSLRFEKCQFAQTITDPYDENDAYEEDCEDTLNCSGFHVKHYVIFRLCPKNTCAEGCTKDYGEYLVDMTTYLALVTEYYGTYVEATCEACENNCMQDDNYHHMSDSCTACMTECNAYQYMEDYGYVDSINYLECTQVNDYDDDSRSVYIGPRCASDGTSIDIGVFHDISCSKVIESQSAESVLRVKLSDHVLKAASDQSCISCIDETENDDGYGNRYSYTSEMCMGLYGLAAKCETPYKFSGGYLKYYSKQVDNEDTACKFIESLKGGTYDVSGSVNLSSKNHGSAITRTTGAQRFFLTAFTISTVFLAWYGAMLRKRVITDAAISANSAGYSVS